MHDWTRAERAQLADRGISEAEVTHQLRHFLHPPAPARLVRPCLVGDGIERVPAEAEGALLARHAEAAGMARFTKFVPASGAATRMFHTLHAMQDDPGLDDPAGLERRADAGEAGPRDLRRAMADAARFPFADALARELARRGGAPQGPGGGGARAFLAAMLDRDGLNLPATAKGLLPFHRYPGGARTPFEEHLAEGAATVRDRDGVCRFHFTVSAESRAAFEDLLRETGAAWRARLGVDWRIAFSIQDPSTDTIAVDPANRPFRDADGSLVFRPGGHGALLKNLQELDADLVYVKNIDNVVPDHRRAPTILWKRLLAGRVAELRDRIDAALRALDAGDRSSALLAEGMALAGVFGDDRPRDGEDAADFLRRRLDRPLRVCGVVKNEGEPGGGPFWVRDGEGRTSRQIVEGSQVDADDPAQVEIWRSSTHFNPVDLVCAMRDHRGRPYDLARFVDDETVFIASKSKDGRPLKALERPGLWNGAMAFWNTLFVEVPIETFAPVKTVFDLLRPQHQPAP